MRSMILAVACTACWPSSPPREPPPAKPVQTEPPRDAVVSRDAASPDAPSATACPVAYGSTDTCIPAEPSRVVIRERTDVGQGPGSAENVASLAWPRCTYPQGTCACVQGPPTCSGGAALRPAPPGWKPPPFHWECTPAVRADGCPGVPPTPDDPCTIAHGCGYCITRFSCDQGRWSVPIVGPPAP